MGSLYGDARNRSLSSRRRRSRECANHAAAASMAARRPSREEGERRGRVGA